MKTITSELNKSNYGRVNNDLALKKEFVAALKDEKFKALVSNLKIEKDLAYKYTSKLQDTVAELSNCKECKALCNCPNKIKGYVNYPNVINNKIIFSCLACKYKKKQLNESKKEQNFFAMPVEIKGAAMSKIDINDKKRVKVIKWLKDFYDHYDTEEKKKGLYLHGNFGSGKTYLITAMLNELNKKKHSVLVVYYPELLRSLKASFDTDFKERVDYIANVELLLLDDIGAENVTAWSRDEILGTILQNRMDNNLTTFFTSNLTIEELENHFAITKQGDELIKARRIIERIKLLATPLELISENRRK